MDTVLEGVEEAAEIQLEKTTIGDMEEAIMRKNK